MKRILALTAAAFVAVAPFAAIAEDTAATTTTITTEVAAPVEHTLKDGTKVSVEGDAVFVVAADGTKTAAPDGNWELADGSWLKTLDGKVAPADPAGQNIDVKVETKTEGAAH